MYSKINKLPPRLLRHDVSICCYIVHLPSGLPLNSNDHVLLNYSDCLVKFSLFWKKNQQKTQTKIQKNPTQTQANKNPNQNNNSNNISTPNPKQRPPNRECGPSSYR